MSGQNSDLKFEGNSLGHQLFLGLADDADLKKTKNQKYSEFAHDEIQKFDTYAANVIKQYVQSLKYLAVLNDHYLLGKVKEMELSKLQTVIFLKNLVKIEKSFIGNSTTSKKLEKQKKGLTKEFQASIRKLTSSQIG